MIPSDLTSLYINREKSEFSWTAQGLGRQSEMVGISRDCQKFVLPLQNPHYGHRSDLKYLVPGVSDVKVGQTS